MQITSPAFGHHQKIPQKYTCDGESIHPELHFLNVPAEAKSLVVIVEDPDVPKHLKADGMFDHWVIFNIPPDIKSIPEHRDPPGYQGLNSAGKIGYFGPCPPDGEHRYFFKLYALDTKLSFDDLMHVTKKMLMTKMKKHVIDSAELIGVYTRS